MSKTQASMDNFGGFNDASDIDFFGEATATEETKTVDTTDTTDDGGGDEGGDEGKTTTDTTQTTDTTKTEEDEKQEDLDFFGSTDIEEDEDESEEEESKKTTNKNNEAPVGGNIGLLNQLKDRGLADFELEEGEELTEERAAELIEDSYEAGIDKKLGELLAELPPVTRDLVKFAAKGGNESEFLAKLSKQPSATAISKDMDLSQEANQELVMRKQLETEGHDQEYIDANIEFLKDSGKLEGLSKKYHGKIIEKDEAQRAADVKAVEDRRKAMKENQRKFKATLANHLKETKEINGMPFDPKKDADLPSYMNDATIKTESGQEISAFQRDLFEAMQDPNNSLLLAKLLRNKFDMSAVANKAKTNQTKKVQEDVRRAKTSAKSSGSSRNSKRSLADFFGD